MRVKPIQKHESGGMIMRMDMDMSMWRLPEQWMSTR